MQINSCCFHLNWNTSAANYCVYNYNSYLNKNPNYILLGCLALPLYFLFVMVEITFIRT